MLLLQIPPHLKENVVNVASESPKPMNDETRKFLENWRRLAIIDLLGRLADLIDHVDNVTENADGTVTIYWKNGPQLDTWIERGVALRRITERINNPCFTIAGISFKFI